MIIQRANTILYCQHWQDTVRFYREVLGFTISFENDWFVEFVLNAGSSLSIADASRATIRSVDGKGITLAWQVADLAEIHSSLQAQGILLSPISEKWGASVCYLHDPEGHRIELWQPLNEDTK